MHRLDLAEARAHIPEEIADVASAGVGTSAEVSFRVARIVDGRLSQQSVLQKSKMLKKQVRENPTLITNKPGQGWSQLTSEGDVCGNGLDY